jgi:hypothetical protein
MVSRWRAVPYTCFVNAKLIRGALLSDIKAISRCHFAARHFVNANFFFPLCKIRLDTVKICLRAVFDDSY